MSKNKIAWALCICLFTFAACINDNNGIGNNEDNLTIENVDIKSTNQYDTDTNDTEKITCIANNDYFFQEFNKEYKYSVRLFFEDDIAELPVKLQYLKSYDDGDVYSLSIQHEDCPERYYYDVLDRFDIGTFYVTDDEIYLLLQCKDVPDEEAFLSDGFLVCGSDDMDENIDGEHLKIKNEGDTCYFYMDNTLTESGYYSSYGWTKGKGLTYFRSGYGAEGDPIEIELKD